MIANRPQSETGNNPRPARPVPSEKPTIPDKPKRKQTMSASAASVETPTVPVLLRSVSESPAVPVLLRSVSESKGPTKVNQMKDTTEGRRTLLRSRGCVSMDTDAISSSRTISGTSFDDVFTEPSANDPSIRTSYPTHHGDDPSNLTHHGESVAKLVNENNVEDLTNFLEQLKPNFDIPGLPYPRLELTFNEPFDHVRQFIAKTRSEADVYPTSKQIKENEDISLSLRKLQAYLARLEEMEEEKEVVDSLGEALTEKHGILRKESVEVTAF